MHELVFGPGQHRLVLQIERRGHEWAQAASRNLPK